MSDLPARSRLRTSSSPPAAPLPRRLGPEVPAGPLEDPDWRRYLAAARRFRWLVAGVTVAGTIAGLVVARILKPWFEAQGTVWTQVADHRDTGGERGGALLASSGWVDLLRSDAVLDSVVRELRLYLHAAAADSDALASFDVRREFRPGSYTLTVDRAGRGFTLTLNPGRVTRHGVVGDSVGADLGLAWVPAVRSLTAGRKIAFVLSSVYSAAQQLGEAMRVQPDLDGNFISVSLRGPDPDLITDIVNGVLNHLVRVAAELKRQKLTELAKILGDQMAQAQANLSAVEQRLKDFRVRTITVLTPGAWGAGSEGGGSSAARDPAVARLADLRVSREALRVDRAAIERVLAEAGGAGLSSDALAMIGAVQRSSDLSEALRELTQKQADLRALRYRYTERNAQVQRLAEDVTTLERRTIPMLARALVVELATREAETTARIDSAAGKLRELPPLAIEELRLEREVAGAEQLFAAVQQRYQATRLEEASSIPDVRVLDHATRPEDPVVNPGPVVVLLALAGSFGLAVVGAVLLERFDPRVRSPTQVTGRLGLVVLGAVPRANRGNAEAGADAGHVIEAMRGIRLNVLHAYGAAGPVLVTVSSPGKGDGKSFVASNLALAFAETGQRTLLIDGDVRRGGLHRVLGRAREPGLTDLLGHGRPVEEVVQATAYPSLAFIGCGERVATAPELLSGNAMPLLLAALKPNYDVILVDSAPLAAGVDAYVLSTMTGSLLLVFRTGVSNGAMAEAKLEVLDRLPVRVLGGVLNDVRPGGSWYRYYSYYLEGYELPHAPRRSVPTRAILRSSPRS